jgi:zinc transport system substrate-binding protein
MLEKRRIASTTLLLFVALALSIAGCSGPPETSGNAGALIVFVSIPPQAWLVERIGGTLVDVHVMVGPGQEPHTFEPQPRQLAELAKAALYFKVGVPFEERVAEKVAAAQGRLKLVDSARGIHSAGSHEHGEDDPHVWLSPRNLKIMAVNISAALTDADPGNAARYKANLSSLLAELDTLDSHLHKILAPYTGRSFYVIHPAFGRFGEAYELHQVALEEEGKPPSPRRLADLMKEAREDGARVVFAQPQFDRRSADALASAIGAEVVILDPLARDVPVNLVEIAEALVKALKGD